MREIFKIWLVDDDPVDLFITRKMIASWQIPVQIEAISDPIEALASLGEAAAHGQADLLQLLFLDINMPGMNGFELLERCQAKNYLQHVTVIVLSSSHHPEDCKKAQHFGVQHFFQKPLTLDKLQGLLLSPPYLKLVHQSVQ